MPTNANTGDTLNPSPKPQGHGGPRSDENPGYETTDVNISGVVVFLAGLMGFLVIFFVFCFGMGKVINSALEKQDGPVTKWNQMSALAGTAATGKRQDLATNPEMQQRSLQQMTKTFPNPRLDIDDGNQATADLHAREDLLLEHYSSIPGQQAIRIPIEQAMAVIARKGLPVAAQSAGATTELAGDAEPKVLVPLTTGFARTGYELEVMEARAQKLSYGKAAGAEHADLKQIR